MAGGKLTDKAIKNAKPGERLVILSDGAGLQLWLTPTGGKLWNYAYRFGGKRKRLAIGPYGKDPAGVPLEAARKRRDDAAGLLRDGVDPATRKRQVKAARVDAHANTFAVVADELLAKKKREEVAAATSEIAVGERGADGVLRRGAALNLFRPVDRGYTRLR